MCRIKNAKPFFSLSPAASCTQCASAGCTCRIGGRWYGQRVLAHAVRNCVDPSKNMPNSTLTEANAQCMRETGADKQTTKKTACQRRAASVYLDGKPTMTDDHLGAFLHHAPSSTARAHYAIGFPLDCVVGIAGCDLQGRDYDRLSGLNGDKLRLTRLQEWPPRTPRPGPLPKYPTLVYSTLPPWFKAWHIRLLLSDEEGITSNQRRFMDDIYESMAQFIEAAARFRIDAVHQDYAFYGYPPFNIRGGEFDEFVEGLRHAIEAGRPTRESMGRSLRFLEAGDVGGAMNTAAKLQANANGVQLRENNAAVAAEVVAHLLPVLGSLVEGLGGRSAAEKFTSSLSAAMPSDAMSSGLASLQGLARAGTAGRGAPGAAIAAALPPVPAVNPKNPATWPDDPTWVTSMQPKLLLNPCPRNLLDLYNEWNVGHLNWPALRHLEEKYPRGIWRKNRSAFSQKVGRIRIYNKFMNTLADVQTLQEELYTHFKLSSDEEKADVRWPRMRKFCDDVLRPRRDGFGARSAENKRRKTVQKRSRIVVGAVGGARSGGGGAGSASNGVNGQVNGASAAASASNGVNGRVNGAGALSMTMVDNLN